MDAAYAEAKNEKPGMVCNVGCVVERFCLLNNMYALTSNSRQRPSVFLSALSEGDEVTTKILLKYKVVDVNCQFKVGFIDCVKLATGKFELCMHFVECSSNCLLIIGVRLALG